MAKNKNSRSRQPRYRKSRPAHGRQPPKDSALNPAPTDQSATSSNKPQFEWVKVEHRDSDGNPTFPKELIQSTYRRRFSEADQASPLRALALTGYKPEPLLLVERKIYQVRDLTVLGWRRRGQIEFELDGWRARRGVVHGNARHRPSDQRPQPNQATPNR